MKIPVNYVLYLYHLLEEETGLNGEYFLVERKSKLYGERIQDGTVKSTIAESFHDD